MADERKPSIESIHRVAKLPVIESTLNKASEMYGKLKETNETVNTVLTSAENAMKLASETAQPVAAKLEGPIKKVDSVLCSGLDYVEEKVPAIKLPTNELAQKTKEALNANVVEPAKKHLAEMTKDAVNATVVDPAKKGVSAVEEYGKQKLAAICSYAHVGPKDKRSSKCKCSSSHGEFTLEEYGKQKLAAICSYAQGKSNNDKK